MMIKLAYRANRLIDTLSFDGNLFLNHKGTKDTKKGVILK